MRGAFQDRERGPPAELGEPGESHPASRTRRVAPGESLQDARGAHIPGDAMRYAGRYPRVAWRECETRQAQCDARVASCAWRRGAPPAKGTREPRDQGTAISTACEAFFQIRLAARAIHFAYRLAVKGTRKATRVQGPAKIPEKGPIAKSRKITP